MNNPVVMAESLIFALVVLAYAFGAKLCWDKFSKMHTNLRFNNTAYGIRTFSLMTAISIALYGTLKTVSQQEFGNYFLQLVINGLVVTIFVLIAQYVNDVFIITGLNNNEAVARKNNAVAVTETGSSIATAVIAYGAFSGGIGSRFVQSVVFLILGQVVLIAVFHLFDWLHPADLLGNIRTGEVPSAIVSSGMLIAVSLILKSAIQGQFFGWGKGFAEFFFAAAMGLGLLVTAYNFLCRRLPWIPNMGEEVGDSESAFVSTAGLLIFAFMISVAFQN